MALFGKKNKDDAIQYIDTILGWQSDEIIVLRSAEEKPVYANRTAQRRLGISNASDYFSHFRGLRGGIDFDEFAAMEKAVVFETEDVNGLYFSVIANNITWIDDRPATIVLLHDITESKKAEKRLYSLAYIDQLINIPNRRKFYEDFTQISSMVSMGTLLGIVAIFDLDNFKSINDTYGHNTGDLILKRLADHVQNIQPLKGSLYRLGGDEFVIMLSSPSKEFGSFEEFVEHHTELLKSVLGIYTIPNIELSCTLSMGVAFFPAHGDSTSELLRKADIALYQAKENGRNQLVVFEDKYDKAKKFKNLYINIQPVLMGSGKTFGYELVDRGNGDDENEEEEDSVVLTDLNRTLDAFGLEELNDSIRYFINYSDQLLNPVVLNNLPTDKFIIRLHIASQLTRRDISRITELRKSNYSIALIGINSSSATKTVLENAQFCKFDPADKNYMTQNRIITANPNINFIASDVNTLDDFSKAQKAGYRLFQGFYFNAPVKTEKTKELNPISSNYYRLIQLTSSDGPVDFREISNIISSDVALSYKLLRILNSAAVGLKNVSSISMAVAYLGEENLKKWIGLLALRGIANDKPLELVRMSLIRARFGELLAPHINSKSAEKHLFLLGILSLLHIAMETTREELLAKIPVTEKIRDSLLTKSGPYSAILQFYEDYEYGNWEDVTRFTEENAISCEVINDCYINAVKWYNTLARAAG